MVNQNSSAKLDPNSLNLLRQAFDNLFIHYSRKQEQLTSEIDFLRKHQQRLEIEWESSQDNLDSILKKYQEVSNEIIKLEKDIASKTSALNLFISKEENKLASKKEEFDTEKENKLKDLNKRENEIIEKDKLLQSTLEDYDKKKDELAKSYIRLDEQKIIINRQLADIMKQDQVNRQKMQEIEILTKKSDEIKQGLKTNAVLRKSLLQQQNELAGRILLLNTEKEKINKYNISLNEKAAQLKQKEAALVKKEIWLEDRVKTFQAHTPSVK